MRAIGLYSDLPIEDPLWQVEIRDSRLIAALRSLQRQAD
jgi:hypothetical protein